MDMNAELLKRLDAIAAKLGVTATYLWGVLLRQAKVEAWTDLMWMVISLLVITGCGFCFYKVSKAEGSTIWDELDGPIVAVGGVVGLIFLIVLIICLTDLPTMLFNPDYYAFRKLVEMLTAK